MRAAVPRASRRLGAVWIVGWTWSYGFRALLVASLIAVALAPHWRIAVFTAIVCAIVSVLFYRSRLLALLLTVLTIVGASLAVHQFQGWVEWPLVIIAVAPLFVLWIMFGWLRPRLETRRDGQMARRAPSALAGAGTADGGEVSVEAFDAVWGSTRRGGERFGLRAANSHGTVLEATFVSEHPSFPPGLNAIVRFSNVNGPLQRDDRVGQPHGMAVKLADHPDGRKGADLLLLDIDRFNATYPEDFLDFIALLRRPGLGRGVVRLVLTARSTLNSVIELVQVSVFGRKRSYLSRRYHSLSTFRIRADGGGGADTWEYVRFFAKPARRSRSRVNPELDGGLALDRELRGRVRPESGENRTMELYLVRDCGVPDNRVIDPRHTWPPFRKRFLGTLTMTACHAEDDAGLRFDPTRLPDDIEPIYDPIMIARVAAYAESFERRTCPVG